MVSLRAVILLRSRLVQQVSRHFGRAFSLMNSGLPPASNRYSTIAFTPTSAVRSLSSASRSAPGLVVCLRRIVAGIFLVRDILSQSSRRATTKRRYTELSPNSVDHSSKWFSSDTHRFLKILWMVALLVG